MTIQLAELLQFLHILGEGDSKQTTVVMDHPSSTQVSVVAWGSNVAIAGRRGAEVMGHRTVVNQVHGLCSGLFLRPTSNSFILKQSHEP